MVFHDSFIWLCSSPLLTSSLILLISLSILSYILAEIGWETWGGIFLERISFRVFFHRARTGVSDSDIYSLFIGLGLFL